MKSGENMKKILVLGVVGTIIIILMMFLRFTTGNVVLENFNGDAKFYKTMECGCCGLHSDYLENKGLDLDRVEMQDISEIKRKYNIPTELESCHTMLIENYFVEGHVPVEAIEKLIKEKPDIAGITLPGMPSGSPGMPGAKNGEWIIYAVNNDGSHEEFMRI